MYRLLFPLLIILSVTACADAAPDGAASADRDAPAADAGAADGENAAPSGGATGTDDDAPAADGNADDDTAPGSDTGAAVPTISGAGIGCVRIGMPAADVRSACPGATETSLTLEGMTQPALRVDVGGGATAVAELTDGRVWRIRVTEPGPTTADGIGVGTPAARLADIEGIRVVAGEGVFALSPAHCGLSFGLDGVPMSAAGSASALANHPDAEIATILIVGTSGC